MVQKIFPCVTTVARKRPQSFCKKYGWQVTAKHTCTLRMWLCMKQHDAWSYGVYRTLRDGSNFTWHQPCQHCKYPTLVDIQKRATRKLVTHVKSHMSAASLLESGEQCHVKAIKKNVEQKLITSSNQKEENILHLGPTARSPGVLHPVNHCSYVRAMIAWTVYLCGNNKKTTGF